MVRQDSDRLPSAVQNVEFRTFRLVDDRRTGKEVKGANRQPDFVMPTFR